MERPKYFNQILVIAAQNLVIIASGLSTAWSTVTIPIFSDPDTCPYERCEENLIPLVASIALFTMIMGIMAAGPLVNIIGRKLCIIIGSAVLTLSWIIIPFSSTMIQVLIARVLSGLGVGFVTIPCFAYIGEISSVSTRGAALATATLSTPFGSLIMFIVGAFLSFRTISFIVLVAAAMALIVTFFIPESPSFLVMKGHIEKAEMTLKWLRQTDNEIFISEELKLIQTSLEHSPKSSIMELFITKSNRRPFTIIMIIYGLEGINGIQVINIFATTIFGSIDTTLRPELQTIILGVFKVIPGIIAPFIIDKLGRRIIFIGGFAVAALFLALLGVFFYFETNIFEESGMYSWVPLALITVIILADGAVAPVNGLLSVEIFQEKVRGVGLTLTYTLYYLMGFGSSLAFGYLMNIFNTYFIFWFFAVVCTVIVTYVYLQLPETMGKNSDEIRQYFEK